MPAFSCIFIAIFPVLSGSRGRPVDINEAVYYLISNTSPSLAAVLIGIIGLIISKEYDGSGKALSIIGLLIGGLRFLFHISTFIIITWILHAVDQYGTFDFFYPTSLPTLQRVNPSKAVLDMMWSTAFWSEIIFRFVRGIFYLLCCSMFLLHYQREVLVAGNNLNNPPLLSSPLSLYYIAKKFYRKNILCCDNDIYFLIFLIAVYECF